MVRGCGPREIMKRFDIPWRKLPFIAADMRSRMRKAIGQIPLFPGVPGLLQELSRRGTILAIVSSNSWENIRRILGPEVASLIRYTECNVSMFGKTSRLKKILSASRISSRDAIFIGDEVRDGEAARKAGVAFGAVTWGYNNRESLEAGSPEEMFEEREAIFERL